MKTYTIDDDIKLLEGYRTVVVPYLMQRLADLEEKNDSTIDFDDFESDNKRLLELAYLGAVVHEVNEIVEQLDPLSCAETIRKIDRNVNQGLLSDQDKKNCNEVIELLESLAAFKEGQT
jgi:hypothetical protein